MYNFVFWFFYKFFEWRKRFKSIFVAASIVGVTIIVHLVLVYSIIRNITGLKIQPFQGSYGSRKYVLMGIALVFFFFIYLVYSKANAKEILKKYQGNRFSNLKNVFLIIVILILPLVIVLLLNSSPVGASVPLVP